MEMRQISRPEEEGDGVAQYEKARIGVVSHSGGGDAGYDNLEEQHEASTSPPRGDGDAASDRGASLPADPPSSVLPSIVIAQVAGTSLWFGVNAVSQQMQRELSWSDGEAAWIATGVQVGFILGTLALGLSGLADVIEGRWIFLSSCVVGAAANSSIALFSPSLGAGSAILLRVVCGMCLAGIYPIGMSTAATWYPQGLGFAVGWLVGALVLGSAAPHLLVACGGLGTGGGDPILGWAFVLHCLSGFALAGGAVLAVFAPPGPAWKRGAARLSVAGSMAVWRQRAYVSALCGYLGHMWELYAFWMAVPLVLARIPATAGMPLEARALAAFGVMAVGAVGCVAGGYASQRWGSALVAAGNLAVSGACCLASPLLGSLPTAPALGLLVVWGLTVIPDSPQCSALMAKGSLPEYVATALTLGNCLGFTVSLVSMNLIAALISDYGASALVVLAPGPALGLVALRRLMV